jgi:hypothetical protein
VAFIEELKKGYNEGLEVGKVVDEVAVSTGFCGQKLTKEVRARGKDLTTIYIRPTIKPREIGNIAGGFVSSLGRK